MGERDTPPRTMPNDHSQSDPTGERTWREVMGDAREAYAREASWAAKKPDDNGQDVGRHASGEASTARCPIAFSKRHSRTYTTLKGMDRIARHRASRASKSSERTPSTRGPGARDDGTLRLLLVGADRTEGTCPRDTAAVFDGLLADAGKTNASESSSSSSSSSPPPPPLFRRAMEGVRRVDVVLVGPNVRLDDGVERDVFHAVSRRRDDDDDDDAKETDDDDDAIEIRVAYRVGLYHNLREQDRKRRRDGDRADKAAADDDTAGDERGDDTNDTKEEGDGDRGSSNATAVTDFSPDLALAFNAGVWGYDADEWRPTMREILFEDECPLLVTGYTLAETECDEDALGEMFGVGEGEAGEGEPGPREEVEWLWESEMNPFRSLDERELAFDRGDYLLGGEGEGGGTGAHVMGENCAWQCLAAKTPG